MAWRDREWIALPRRALARWIEDGASSMGAALAFYTLFSLAPLLLVALWVAGQVVGADEAQAALAAQLATWIGDGATAAVLGLLDAASTPGEGGWAALLGLATLLLGATTVFAELKGDLDRIWGSPRPAGGGLLRLLATRLVALAMVIGVGVVLVASFAASAFVAAAGELLFAAAKPAVHALEFAASFVVITGLFAMIYKLLPSERLEWRDVWWGAAITSALFWLGKFLIALYIARTGVASGFGAAGAVVLVIVWVYWSAQVFFLGAEVTREFALRHGSHRGEEADTEGTGKPRRPRRERMVLVHGSAPSMTPPRARTIR